MAPTALPDYYNSETKQGRWQYKRVLGEGAFGVVHEAIDVQTGEHVAVKVFRTKKTLDCLLASREVRCAQYFRDYVFPKTKHRIFVDYREDQTGLAGYPDEALFVWAEHGLWENKRIDACLRHDPYVVMEYVEGVCVREMIKDDKLTLADCGSILHQAAYALKGMHDHNCIHRDFRVHNLMWHDGKLKVLDFGLALMDCVSGSKSSTNPLVRTFWQADSYWMPPEVKRHGKICNFSLGAAYSFDIYSLGVLMIELLLDPLPHKKMTRNKHAIEEQGKTRLDPLKAVDLIDRMHLRATGFKPEFLSRCLHPRGQDRPTPDTVLQVKEKCYVVVAPGDLNSRPFFVFREELTKIAGPNRADTSIHLIGEVSRKIIDNADFVSSYSQILLKFAHRAGVSVYRILCIIDCVCRLADKNASNSMTKKVTNAFAPMMKYFIKEAYDKYDTPDSSRKDGVCIELGKVEYFVANWIRLGRFTEDGLTAKVREAHATEGLHNPEENKERVAKQLQRLSRAKDLLAKKEQRLKPKTGAVKTADKENDSVHSDGEVLPSGDKEKTADDDVLARRLAKVQQLMAARLETQAHLRDRGLDGDLLPKRNFLVADGGHCPDAPSTPDPAPPEQPANPLLSASDDDDAAAVARERMRTVASKTQERAIPQESTSKAVTQSTQESTTATARCSLVSSSERASSSSSSPFDRKKVSEVRSSSKRRRSRSQRKCRVVRGSSGKNYGSRKRLLSISHDSPTIRRRNDRCSSSSPSAERARRFVIERNAKLKRQEEEERNARLRRQEDESRRKREKNRRKRQEEERNRKWWLQEERDVRRPQEGKYKAVAHRNNAVAHRNGYRHRSNPVAVRRRPVRWKAASDVSSESSIHRRLSRKSRHRRSVSSSSSSSETDSSDCISVSDV